MAYEKTNWANGELGGTPIDADALNHMEDGIEANDIAVRTKLDLTDPTFIGNMTGTGNVTVGGEVENGNGETLHGAYQSAESVLPIDTESGNPTVITDAFGGACKSLKLTLEPIQSGSGTPSPSNVRPISGRTQSVVNRYGKNLTPLPTLQGLWLTADGTFDPRSTWVATTKFSVLPGKTYTASATRETRSFAVVYWDENGDYIGYDANTTFGAVLLTFTTPSNCATIALEVADRYNGAGIVPSDVTDLILYPGSTATTYEPYIEPISITRTYGTTIYGGSDDVTGDGVTSEWVGVDSSLWTQFNANNGYKAYRADGLSLANTVDSGNVCNMINEYGSFSSGNMNKNIIQPPNSSGTAYMALDENVDVTTIQYFYKVATPTSIPLTSQNLPLLKGDNVITTDADSIDVEYSADIALYIAKKIAEGSQGNRSLSKGGASEEEPKEEEPKEVEVNER